MKTFLKKIKHCFDYLFMSEVFWILLIIILIATVIVFLMIHVSLSIQSSGAEDLKYTPDIGSLIGGTLGGIGTLFAVKLTIEHGAKQAKEDKRKQALPFITVTHLNGGENLTAQYENDYELVPEDDMYLQKVGFSDYKQPKFNLQLVFTNIGSGPAINVNMKIQQGEKTLPVNIPFHINNNSKIKRDMLFYNGDGDQNFKIILEFSDILGNKYTQECGFAVERQWLMGLDYRILLKDFISPVSTPKLLKI